MKKLSAASGEIEFKVNGTLTLEITEEGVIVADDVATLVHSRLGGQVTVEDVSTKEAAAAAAKVVDSTSVEGPVVPTNKMNTENLTILAKSEGATDEQLGECKKKDDIVALILANREKGAGAPDPE